MCLFVSLYFRLAQFYYHVLIFKFHETYTRLMKNLLHVSFRVKKIKGQSYTVLITSWAVFVPNMKRIRRIDIGLRNVHDRCICRVRSVSPCLYDEFASCLVQIQPMKWWGVALYFEVKGSKSSLYGSFNLLASPLLALAMECPIY